MAKSKKGNTKKKTNNKNNSVKKNTTAKKTTNKKVAAVEEVKVTPEKVEVKKTKKPKEEKTSTKKGVKLENKIRKEKKVPKTTMIKNDSEITKLIKIVLIVTAIMVVFYGITLLVTKNKSADSLDEKKASEKAVIQYDDIMIGTMLNKDQDRYYVLIKEDGDNRVVEYETLMKFVASKTDAPKIYTANLTDSFNKKYLAKEANESNDMEEFRVSGTTLVEINDGEIANMYSGHESIAEELKALAD